MRTFTKALPEYVNNGKKSIVLPIKNPIFLMVDAFPKVQITDKDGNPMSLSTPLQEFFEDDIKILAVTSSGQIKRCSPIIIEHATVSDLQFALKTSHTGVTS